MTQASRKRIARVKVTLTKRTVEALEPGTSPWIAWDDRLTGFGVRVQPSGTKAFVVNYRSGGGGRRAPNRRVVIGRYGAMTPDKARRVAQEVLGRVAVGDDPAGGSQRRAPDAAAAGSVRGVPGRQPEPQTPTPCGSTAARSATASATGWRGRSTPSPAGTWKRGSTSSPSGTAGRSPTTRPPCCGRRTGGPAWTTRASATPWTCGSTGAGGTTAACGGGFRRRRRSCRAGGPESRRRSSSR